MDPAAFQFLTGRPWGQADQERTALAGYVDGLAADNRRREEERNARIREALGQTWPAQMVKSAVSAMALPGDVYAGRVDPNSDEAIGRSADLAGLLTFGAGAAPASRNEMRMGIKAYHGSPHDFDRFDMSKIGTGEGAQAYGHGLYFAGNEAVAKGYRDALSGKIGNVPVMMDGVRYNPPTDQHQRVAAIIAKDGRRAAMENYRSLRDQGILQPEQDAVWKELLSFTKGRAIEAAPAGRMYEVELNTTPDRLLDWDKPLSRQPAAEAAIGQYLEKALDHPAPIFEGLFQKFETGQMTGADAARMVGTETGHLRRAGIDGIQYLDGQSRGAGEGSRNYVMFDDRLVKILRKYGVAGVSALPAAALAELGITREEAERMY